MFNTTYALVTSPSIVANATPASPYEVNETVELNITGSGGFPGDRTWGWWNVSGPAGTTYLLGNSSEKFTAAGTYWANASALDLQDVYQTESIVLPVQATTAIASSAYDVDVGVDTNFYAFTNGPSTGPVNYTWTFSDGMHWYGDIVNRSFPTPGDWFGNVTITDAYTSCDASTSIVVVAQPAAVISTPDLLVKANATLPFSSTVTGGVPLLYFDWTFGDGTEFAAFHGGASHSYAVPGTYTVRLNVTDGDGIVASSNTLEVNVSSSEPLTAFASANLTQAALGDPIYFTAHGTGGTGPYSFAWRFDDGSHFEGAAGSHAFETSGTHTAVVWVNDSAGDSQTATVVVRILSGAAPKHTSPNSGPAPFPYTDLALVLAALAAVLLLVVGLRGRGRNRKPNPPAPWVSPSVGNVPIPEMPTGRSVDRADGPPNGGR